jgi:hypothetical protein
VEALQGFVREVFALFDADQGRDAVSSATAA